jgi:hypothetical protein
MGVARASTLEGVEFFDADRRFLRLRKMPTTDNANRIAPTDRK